MLPTPGLFASVLSTKGQLNTFNFSLFPTKTKTKLMMPITKKLNINGSTLLVKKKLRNEPDLEPMKKKKVP